MKTVGMTSALQADRHEIRGRSGRLSYYVAGEGPPALLVHSVNAAAAAHEVAPAFLHLRGKRRVYAPDLPGFGYSERSDRPYGIGLYCDAIRDMLDVIVAEHGTVALDALGLSLSSEFLARVSTEVPARFRTLTLVTPTGFQRGADTLRAAPGSSREIAGMHAVVNSRLWRNALFSGLVSRPSIRYFLQRTFGSKNVPESLVAYSWITAHQPGACHAPLAFLSGRLFSRDIRDVYEKITTPVLLAEATRGDFSDFSEAAWTRTRQNWRTRAYATGAMVYFEQPDAFFRDWDALLETDGDSRT